MGVTDRFTDYTLMNQIYYFINKHVCTNKGNQTIR